MGQRESRKRSHLPAATPVKEVVPYTRDEIIQMLAACDRIGNEPYERLRAKAAMLLMYRYGFRISDVAMFRRSSVRDGRVFMRVLKNGGDLFAPLYDDVRHALECLPVPDGCANSEFYFWTATSDLPSIKKSIWRTLHSAFQLSGVKAAHPHRFRHTLATEILVSSGTMEDVANILGDSETVCRKHYIRWCPQYQARISEVFDAVYASIS